MACPYCEGHPAIVNDMAQNCLCCPSCNRQYFEWAGKPSFIDDKLFPSGKFWRESYLKSKADTLLFGIPKKKLYNLCEKLRAPRVYFRKLPHFELLSKLSKRGSFKALYIGYNQHFDQDVSKNVVQLNVIPEKYVDVVAMGEYVPFPDKSFDLVVLSGVIEHTQQPFKVVEEAYRVLRPSGKIYLSAPWVYPFHGGDNYRFSNEGLKLLCCRFNDLEVGSLNGPLHALAVFLGAFIEESLSFGNRHVRYLLGIATSWLTFPLKFIDALTNPQKKNKYILDANIYVMGTTSKQNYQTY